MFNAENLEEVREKIDRNYFENLKRKLTIEVDYKNSEYYFSISGNYYVVSKYVNNDDKEESFKLYLLKKAFSDYSGSETINKIISYDVENIYSYLRIKEKIESLKKEVEKLESDLCNIEL